MTSLAQDGCAHFYHYTISVCFLVEREGRGNNSSIFLSVAHEKKKKISIITLTCVYLNHFRFKRSPVYLFPASRRGKKKQKPQNDGKICEIEICHHKPGGAALFYGSTCGIMFALLTFKESISARERLLAAQTKCPQRPQCIE